jgi:hypothetical protein
MKLTQLRPPHSFGMAVGLPDMRERFKTRTSVREQTVAAKSIDVLLACSSVDSHQGPARLWPASNKI